MLDEARTEPSSLRCAPYRPPSLTHCLVADRFPTRFSTQHQSKPTLGSVYLTRGLCSHLACRAGPAKPCAHKSAPHTPHLPPRRSCPGSGHSPRSLPPRHAVRTATTQHTHGTAHSAHRCVSSTILVFPPAPLRSLRSLRASLGKASLFCGPRSPSLRTGAGPIHPHTPLLLTDSPGQSLRACSLRSLPPLGAPAP